jgi:oligogalacturonide lyase
VYWRPDGAAVLYLRTAPAEIREIEIDPLADRLVAAVNRLVHFAPNGDGTVFVGASGSLAQPHILLVLRTPRRELTICEHRARDPRIARPVFSPDSQRVYFLSDAEGKPALHSMAVDRLVAAT